MNACLIRHTTVVTPTGLCYGRADVPLAESFRQDVAEVRKALPFQPAEIWSSPSLRCLELARRLAGKRLLVKIEPRLREMNFGEWEGRLWTSFHGPESDAWALDPWNLRPPGGESGLEMWARVAALRAEILGRAKVALITHAGVIRLWRAMAEDRLPGPDVFNLQVRCGQIWHAD